MKISEENRALLDELSMLKEKHLECTVQESKLRGQLTTCEQSLADAETQAKAYYEKVNRQAGSNFYIVDEILHK